MVAAKSASLADSGSATVSFGSGRRLRSLLDFRTELAEEQTARVASIASTSSASAGKSSAFG